MNYEKFIKQLGECKKDMSDDDIEWFDMGDFQVGMNKGLMDELKGIDRFECRADKDTAKKDPEVKKDDNVNHPKHYTSGKYECLAVMVDTFGVEAVKAFCRCNAFKYIWRSELKNGIEDLKKSIFYINFLIGLEEGKSAEQILNTITK